MRILLLAYACNPYRGSEEGVGWGWVKMAAQRHVVDVITAEFHRSDIERAMQAGQWEPERMRFHYVPARWWHFRPNPIWRRIEGSPLKPIMNLAYARWQSDAYRLARQLQETQRFDLVHLVTYVGFRFAGKFHALDAPFVWGPVGGLENTPWRFLPMMGGHGGIHFAARNVINTLHKAMLSKPKRAFRAARGGIIAATPGMARQIQQWYGEDAEVVCEVGTPPVVAEGASQRAADESLRLAWSGLHNPGKALPLLLRAVARLPADLKWELTILGEGRQTGSWQRLAQRLGIEDRCTWTGWLAREDALLHIQRSHVFVITSMHDLTSTVLLEAMAQGVPVICPDAFGFSHVVTDECGIKVPVRTPRQFQRDVANAIETLANDEARRRTMGEAALRRLQAFTWERKAEVLERVYRRRLGDTSEPSPEAGEEDRAVVFAGTDS